MNINLREEETDQYIIFFQGFLERIQDLNNRVAEVLAEELRDSKYERLQRTIINVVDAYTEVIVKGVKNNSFEKWEASEASLHACLDRYKAGEWAHETCVRVEKKIEELMETMLYIEKREAVITDRPIVSDSGMDHIEDIIKASAFEAEEIKKEFAGRAEAKEEENDIYGTLKPLIQSVSMNISAFLEQSLTTFEKLHEEVREASAATRAAAKEAAQYRQSGQSADHRKASGSVGGENAAVGTRKQILSEENIEETMPEGESSTVFVAVVEKIITQIEIIELNRYAKKHYDSLNRNIKSCSIKIKMPERRKQPSQKQKEQKAEIRKNLYGRYIVTHKSVWLMEYWCRIMDAELEKRDQFYKERFSKREKGFETVGRILHELTSFMELWNRGKEEFTKEFSKDDSLKKILDTIQKGMPALQFGTKTGQMLTAGALTVKFLDKALPKLKKSRILASVDECVWQLARSNMRTSYAGRMIDMYMMERYELKHGISGGKSGWFEYLHEVVLKLKNEYWRRQFENAVFAADYIVMPYCVIDGALWREKREQYCGIFLNLVRSGLCSKQNMKAEDANKLVDQLYDIYVKKEGNTPRVDIDPMKRIVRN